MATYRKRGNQWQVIWKELVVLTQPEGPPLRKWQQQSRSVPTEALAKQLIARIEAAGALGERWQDKREEAVSTLRTIALAYVRAAVEAQAPIPTQRFRSAMIGSFLDFMKARDEKASGAQTPVSALSLSLLERFATSLPGEGRKAQTRYRKTLEVERMWAWAHERPERFPGVPKPRRYTGSASEADKLSAPAPVVAVAAPDWQDIDRMIGNLHLEWHRRIAMLMRFTGLRASQACGLDWKDVDLDRGVLHVRARLRGAKRSRGRVIPLHPYLISQMRTWQPQEGLLFPRRYRDELGMKRAGPYEGDALLVPFRRAWRRSGVAIEKWDVPAAEGEGERGKGSPTHAIRRCIRTALIRAGVEEAIVLYLVGQTQGITAAAYVPESSPEQSPYWPRLLEAVAKIPEVKLES